MVQNKPETNLQLINDVRTLAKLVSALNILVLDSCTAEAENI